MNTQTFNQEIEKSIKIYNNDTLNYIEKEFAKSNSKGYYGFLDTYLYSYGILSFNCNPVAGSSKYFPTITFKEKNIFGKKKGTIELSEKLLYNTECHKMISHYLISKLKETKKETIIQWKG